MRVASGRVMEDRRPRLSSRSRLDRRGRLSSTIYRECYIGGFFSPLVEVACEAFSARCSLAAGSS
jgi:hypothetical protein